MKHTHTENYVKLTENRRTSCSTHHTLLRPQPSSPPLFISRFRLKRFRMSWGPGIGELMATIATQGIKPSGPWFDHHLKMAEDTWDFELACPSARRYSQRVG
jgi:hypothetical protein